MAWRRSMWSIYLPSQLPHPHTALSLLTANGPIAVESVAQICVAALNSVSEALALPSTPMVLSIGWRCVEHGYSFIWEANKAPYMRNSDGQLIHLTVDAHIPYLIDDSSEQLVLPAVGVEPVADPAEFPGEDGSNRDLKAIAQSLQHLLTHFPKNPWCDACRRAKLIHKACPVRDAELPHEAKFGDYLTVDHMIRNGFRLAVPVKPQQLSSWIVSHNGSIASRVLPKTLTIL